MKTQEKYEKTEVKNWLIGRPSIKVNYDQRTKRWFYLVITGEKIAMHYRETGSGYMTREEAFSQGCAVLDRVEAKA